MGRSQRRSRGLPREYPRRILLSIQTTRLRTCFDLLSIPYPMLNHSPSLSSITPLQSLQSAQPSGFHRLEREGAPLARPPLIGRYLPYIFGGMDLSPDTDPRICTPGCRLIVPFADPALMSCTYDKAPLYLLTHGCSMTCCFRAIEPSHPTIRATFRGVYKYRHCWWGPCAVGICMYIDICIPYIYRYIYLYTYMEKRKRNPSQSLAKA
jgi:hypothetical protein